MLLRRQGALLRVRRIATVRAMEQAMLVSIKRHDFRSFLSINPELQAGVEAEVGTLCRRLDYEEPSACRSTPSTNSPPPRPPSHQKAHRIRSRCHGHTLSPCECTLQTAAFLTILSCLVRMQVKFYLLRKFSTMGHPLFPEHRLLSPDCPAGPGKHFIPTCNCFSSQVNAPQKV